MALTIQEARKIIGISNTRYSDEQVEKIIDIFLLISDFAIDSYIYAKNQKEIKKKFRHG